MNNNEKYLNAFVETLEVDASDAENLKYRETENWDSVGHMSLITALEDAFDIMMDTDHIIDLNSFTKGKEILTTNYDVEF